MMSPIDTAGPVWSAAGAPEAAPDPEREPELDLKAEPELDSDADPDPELDSDAHPDPELDSDAEPEGWRGVEDDDRGLELGWGCEGDCGLTVVRPSVGVSRSRGRG
ncbi:hypothetical protein B1H18_32250 [Streptomyces tsukubensis]|uniref:Uncharacterized protein n=1 Tax=Streptomyces tsukubensis TaxID=83656 RepID=A0A1V3ZZF4_9ACTN|nr:hypothetical protein B1H18_32250 [Streptomyces tsukubensis]